MEPLQASLEAFCRRRLFERNDIEDALQSAMANAFRDFHLYVENTNFRAWIFRYVHLEILSRNRRRATSREQSLQGEMHVEGRETGATVEGILDQLLESPEIVLEHCDAVLAAAVEELPELERSVLLLRAIGDFKYREIAEILEIPIGSVMGYLGRSREQLRSRLGEFARERGLVQHRPADDGAEQDNDGL
ncbi:MAG: RNA polymerase sigma factor [Planctomycetes bacterium]|nr:RNA polymerase sigma factor [Planctomycetota bacterium]